MFNYKSQSLDGYKKIYNPSQRKQCEVVTLESSPLIQPINYRFEWISEKLKNKNCQPLNTRVPIRNINLSRGHFLSSNDNSFIDSKIAHSNKGKKNNNSPVTTIQCRKTMDDLSQRNKSYTVVNIKFDKLLQKTGSNSSVEDKKINIFDQSQNKNEIKDKDYNLNIKCNGEYSLSVRNEMVYNPIKCVKYMKPKEDCTVELQKAKGNTSVTPDDLKYEKDLSENDNVFEITVLNNQQLEIKTIII